MAYFITLHIGEENAKYEEITKILEDNGVDLIGVEAVTEIGKPKAKAKKCQHIADALLKHKTKLTPESWL